MMTQKNKNIFLNILILLTIPLNLIFCDPPNWDENGDGVLDNYNDYENNGSITSKVYVDGNDYSELGDMVAAFVSGEQRGVGLAEEVPPFLGEGIAYLMMVYSNQTSGETMSFQYYDLSSNQVYDLNETIPFEINMTLGNVIQPYIFDLEIGSMPNDPPNWDENGDGVLDNYNDYENNGSITSKVYVDGNDYSELGDMVAAFVSGEQRGVGLAEEVPPFLGEGIAYLMMVYSNQTSGETMSFQYYDLSSNQVYDLNETIPFEINMTLGNVIEPYIFTFLPGDLSDIYGCTDPTGCNYDFNASLNDGSCIYPEDNFDCDGNCVVSIDCNNVCGGSAILIDGECCLSGSTDVCGVCDGDNSSCQGCPDETACNFNESSIIDDGSCIYPEVNFDCAGNCLIEIDCNGICGGDSTLDECGNCDSNPFNDCLQDCNGNWGGESYIDNCGNCVGGSTGIEPCLGFDYDLSLNVGGNLVSFNSLPYDNSIQNLLISNTYDFIYSIYGISNSALNLGNNIWQGSLDTIYKNNGYWFKSINTTSLSIFNSFEVSDDLIYNLNIGVNLISFPSQASFLLQEAISEEDMPYINAIIGESLIAVNQGGLWVGSLESFDPNKGYYFVMNNQLDFSYDLSENSLTNSHDFYHSVKMHVQSTKQSFYLIENISDLNLDIGDIILAYNNDVLVGSREIKNYNIIDIPVMGYDDSDYSVGFCRNEDVPNFKVLKINGDLIDLYSDNSLGWIDMGINYINLFYNQIDFPYDFSISNAYPNPFNPITNFELEVNSSEYISIKVYNLNGMLTDEIYNGFLDRGKYNFNWDASSLTSGTYFIKVSSEEKSLSRKVTLIK